MNGIIPSDDDELTFVFTSLMDLEFNVDAGAEAIDGNNNLLMHQSEWSGTCWVTIEVWLRLNKSVKSGSAGSLIFRGSSSLAPH